MQLLPLLHEQCGSSGGTAIAESVMKLLVLLMGRIVQVHIADAVCHRIWNNYLFFSSNKGRVSVSVPPDDLHSTSF